MWSAPVRPDFPIAIVYYAGYADREKVLRSTMDSIVDDVKESAIPVQGRLSSGPAEKSGRNQSP